MQIIFNVAHFNNSFKNTQTREVKSTTEITQTPGSNTQTPGGKKNQRQEWHRLYYYT